MEQLCEFLASGEEKNCIDITYVFIIFLTERMHLLWQILVQTSLNKFQIYFINTKYYILSTLKWRASMYFEAKVYNWLSIQQIYSCCSALVQCLRCKGLVFSIFFQAVTTI